MGECTAGEWMSVCGWMSAEVCVSVQWVGSVCGSA